MKFAAVLHKMLRMHSNRLVCHERIFGSAENGRESLIGLNFVVWKRQ
jgi:hypothetical protein